MEDNDIKYGDNSLRARENIVSKLKSQMNKNVTDHGLRFLKLIEVIPNWETYLTPKQLEVARKYVTCLSAQEVDYQMKLNVGITQQRLFGGSGSKGALGKLEDAERKLRETGYFDRLEKRKELAQEQPKSTITRDELNKTEQLIRLIIEISDYDQYLTKSETDKVVYFMSYRKFSSTAKHLHMQEHVLKSTLLGEILDKLKNVAGTKMVNSWDDI